MGIVEAQRGVLRSFPRGQEVGRAIGGTDRIILPTHHAMQIRVTNRCTLTAPKRSCSAKGGSKYKVPENPSPDGDSDLTYRGRVSSGSPQGLPPARPGHYPREHGTGQPYDHRQRFGATIQRGFLAHNPAKWISRKITRFSTRAGSVCPDSRGARALRARARRDRKHSS